MLPNLLHKIKNENMVMQIDSGYIEYVISVISYIQSPIMFQSPNISDPCDQPNSPL